ncbi:hypothetical protein MKK75_00805, partial [Methylobacterium sp. J-030]|uniref:hypothetical protein n=1 Tax=Methylobacterium sp. J-030 TaxID=2836627 RepID=UPI001FB87B1E
MGSVVAFPSPMSTQRTPVAVEVIVCPTAGVWISWLLLPCGRYVALERTPDKEHALRDARAYSARHHGIPVSVLSGPLAVVLDR